MSPSLNPTTDRSDLLLKAEHLSYSYGAFCAVKDLNLELRRGQVLGFLGPNGAGKSTSLRLLSGVLALQTGRVDMAGYDLRHEPLKAKQALGYLPEYPPLYTDMRVIEYLRFVAQLHGLKGQKIHTACQRVLEQCDIGAVQQRLIGRLSTGYQRRVGIAQALLHEPSVIILDEPTAGLDPLQLHNIRQLIHQLREQCGVILSSHMLPEVEAVSTHVMVMRQGELLLQDTLRGLQQHWQGHSLKLGLRCCPSLDTLEKMAGVLRVETIDEQFLRVHYQAPDNPAEQLVQTAVEQGWGLFEITSEQHSLEHIFMQQQHLSPT